ncbi:hypothetical protein KY363_00865 [Candidatus Woesearchaeota archaeon]|nr:hypothetical protein [Candidatus Woesearchaeota archaeon]
MEEDTVVRNMSEPTSEALCDDLVYTALVKHVTGRLKPTRNFAHVLEPYSLSREPPYGPRGYPLTNIGLLARVTEDRQLAWMNVPKITRYLDRDTIRHAFNRLDEESGRARGSDIERFVARVDFVRNILCAIGTKSYTPEWTKMTATEQIDDVIEDATYDVPANANEILACTLVEKICSHFRRTPEKVLSIWDDGTGSGNTICEVVEAMNLLAAGKAGSRRGNRRTLIDKYPDVFAGVVGKAVPQDYYKRVRIYIQDVSRDAIEMSFRNILNVQPGLVQPGGGGITVIEDNFLDLRYNKVVQDILQGGLPKVDIIIAGASLCHQTKFDPFFRLMSEMLDPEGVMHVWDWYNGPSFAAPYLRLTSDQEGLPRTVFYIRDQHGQVYPKYVYDGEELQWKKKAALYQCLADAKDVRAVYEMTPEESKQVLANFQTWLGFLGYCRGSDSVMVGGLEVSLYLDRLFSKYTQMEAGFNFFRFLEVLENVPTIGPKTAYNIIEGTGVRYGGIMRNNGFAYAEDRSLISLHRELRDDDEKTMSGIEPACNVWIAKGKKTCRGRNGNY